MMKFIFYALMLPLLLHCNLNAMESQEKLSPSSPEEASAKYICISPEKLSDHEAGLFLFTCIAKKLDEIETLNKIIAQQKKEITILYKLQEERAALSIARRPVQAILPPPADPELMARNYETERLIPNSPRRSASPQKKPVYEETGMDGVINKDVPFVPFGQIIEENQKTVVTKYPVH